MKQKTRQTHHRPDDDKHREQHPCSTDEPLGKKKGLVKKPIVANVKIGSYLALIAVMLGRRLGFIVTK